MRRTESTANTTPKPRTTHKKRKGNGVPARKKRWTLNPFARRWLQSPNLGDDPWGQEEMESHGHDWEEWFPAQAAKGNLIKVGGVWVDRYLITAHFACVSERCLPRPGRGHYKCCCADLECVVSHSEGNRMKPHTKRLWNFMVKKERRLIQHCWPPEETERDEPFWLDDSLENLERPDGRCVFSGIDLQGRIRCHLFSYAQSQGIRRREVQPLPCRLFPLVLLDMEDNRLGLTIMGRDNYQYVPTYHPRYFPCLSDPTLPYVTESAQRDLDFFFGDGFAAELRRLRQAGEGLPERHSSKKSPPRPAPRSR